MSELEFSPQIAYFSMEIGLESDVPTYSGGLGVLAGDTLRAAADLRVPIVGVTLIHRKGYFRQSLDALGNQTESPVEWAPESHFDIIPQRVTIEIEERQIRLRAWRYTINGVSGFQIPVYLLDSDVPDNQHKVQGGGGRRLFRYTFTYGLSICRILSRSHLFQVYDQEGAAGDFCHGLCLYNKPYA